MTGAGAAVCVCVCVCGEGGLFLRALCVCRYANFSRSQTVIESGRGIGCAGTAGWLGGISPGFKSRGGLGLRAGRKRSTAKHCAAARPKRSKEILRRDAAQLGAAARAAWPLLLAEGRAARGASARNNTRGCGMQTCPWLRPRPAAPPFYSLSYKINQTSIYAFPSPPPSLRLALPIYPPFSLI